MVKHLAHVMQGLAGLAAEEEAASLRARLEAASAGAAQAQLELEALQASAAADIRSLGARMHAMPAARKQPHLSTKSPMKM